MIYNRRNNDVELKNRVSRLYVFRNIDFDMVKVGVSIDPTKRFSALRGSCGCEMEELFVSMPMIRAHEKEFEVLEKFSEHRAKYGEWIIGHGEEIAEYAKSICHTDDIDVRCLMYIEGMTISDIAREFEVSRQAILKHLKKHGVWIPPEEDEVETKIAELVPDTPGMKNKDDAKITATTILNHVPDIPQKKLKPTWKRVAQNLYASQSGYMVKYFKNGRLIEEVYADAEAVRKAYNMS